MLLAEDQQCGTSLSPTFIYKYNNVPKEKHKKINVEREIADVVLRFLALREREHDNNNNMKKDARNKSFRIKKKMGGLLVSF